MKETILIVDDEPDILQTLDNVLTGEGYRVISASGGMEAIEIFKAESIDLIITDIRMPGMDGVELIHKIKELDKEQQFIALTGFATLDNAILALRNGGAFDYLTKPLEDIEELFLSVEKALEKRKLILSNKRLEEELYTQKIELESQNEELRTTQLALESSKDRYSHLYDFSPVGYFSIGQKGMIEKVNLTGADMIGTERSRIIGKPFVHYIHRNDRDTWYLYQQRFDTGKGKSIPFTLRMLKEGGQEFHANLECLALQEDNGDFMEIRVAIMDITEPKQIEAALKESVERYRDIVEGTDDLIMRVDLEGRVVYVNHVAENVFGLSAKKSIGRFAFDFTHPDDRERSKKEFSVLIDNKPPSITLENRQVNQVTGEIYEMRWTCALKYDEEGNLNAIDSIAHDLTEHKKLEEMMLKTIKLESLGVLAGGIAHDYNNLLSVIMGNISLAEYDIRPEIGSSKNLKEAEKACIRAKELTSRLITFSKGGEPVKRAMPIGDVLKDSVGSALSRSDLNLQFSIPEDLRPVNIDENQINQVFYHMVANAGTAMGGKGLLKITCENVHITGKDTHILKTGEYVKISFEDQGIGISEENLQRIFDPYFSTKDMGADKGQGLGLAVCHSIIDKHDGRITVESELGMGTTFAIYLPTSVKRIIAPLEKKTTGKRSIAGKGKILVMDDESMIRELSIELLRSMGYDSKACRDGAEAIEMYKKEMASGEPFDAAILDLSIDGGMGGVDAIQGLLEIDPEVNGIVSTGYFDDPVVTNFREYGFRGALTKPYSMGELKQILRGFILEN